MAADGACGAGDQGRNVPRASYASQDQHGHDVAILGPQPRVHLRPQASSRRRKKKETHARNAFASLPRPGWEAEASNAAFPPATVLCGVAGGTQDERQDRGARKGARC